MSETTLYLAMSLLVINFLDAILAHILSKKFSVFQLLIKKIILLKNFVCVNEALKRLVGGFQYENNPGLCGSGFSSLKECSSFSDNPTISRPEPYGRSSSSTGFLTKEKPETANLKLNCSSGNHCSNTSKASIIASVIVGVIVVTVIVSAIGLLLFSHIRGQKQKHGDGSYASDNCLSSIDHTKEAHRKNGSPLISLEYSNGWDPLAEGGRYGEVMQSFCFNLEEVESATQYFAEKNLLGKSNFSAVYKGSLRDGSTVAIKSIPKTSCRSEEAEFLKGLNILTSLRHENLIRLRGFCCSRGRKECFLVYDYVSNGNLLQYLDIEDGSDRVLEWSARVSIVIGIAKGEFLVKPAW